MADESLARTWLLGVAVVQMNVLAALADRMEDGDDLAESFRAAGAVWGENAEEWGGVPLTEALV